MKLKEIGLTGIKFSLLGLGFINLGASCDKPLAEVLIGYGLLFLFGFNFSDAAAVHPRLKSPRGLKKTKRDSVAPLLKNHRGQLAS